MRGGEGLTDHILSSQQLWIKSSAEGAVSRPRRGSQAGGAGALSPDKEHGWGAGRTMGLLL